MQKKLQRLLASTLSCCLLFSITNAQTGTWTKVKAPAPHDNMGVCLLLTDGTVICHNTSGGGEGTGWDRLTPDIHGSYVNGTWDSITPMQFDRLFFSSQVLPSGKVYVAGGEYGAGALNGEVYDPVTNSWTPCGAVPGGANIYDGNSELLYNGNVLEGPQLGGNPSFDCFLWSPVTNLYTIAPSAIYNHDEAAWLKLADSSVLFVGIASDSANRYIPQTNTWIKDATVPGNLYDAAEEAGGAHLLPNGKAIFFGATPFNAIYTPTGNTSPGTWAVADSFPVIHGCPVGQSDASSATLVNGHILCAVSPVDACAGQFASPTYFVEYNYTTNTFTQIKDTIPGMSGGDSIPVASYQTQMLDLPDGNILVSVSQTSSYSRSYLIYTPGSGPIPQGKPTIDNLTQVNCTKYMVTGKLFNGISEGASYGDDWQCATNYPLVRLTDGTNVYYAKTSDWNRVAAVQTDSLEDTAYFTLPSIPGANYSAEVVVNGFASSAVPLTVFGVTITAQTNITTCKGLGSATAFASNGNTPYSYLWSPGGGTNAYDSNLTAGTYTVTVTENGGCSASVSVTITAPTITLATTTTGVSCTSGNNGSANVTASGGIMPYIFTWNNGETTTTITGLSAGNYTVSVSDSCGNNSTAMVSVTQPAAISVTTGSIIDETCYGASSGSASATVSGGSASYTYSWTPNGGSNSNATGLSAGTYTITVKDSCNNTATAVATVTQPAGMTIVTDSVNETNSVSCNGKAKVTVTGGNPPYSYLWSPGGQTLDSIYNQCSGTYCCTVTDNSGCSQSMCVVIGNTTGLENITTDQGQVTVYPNPSAGVFTMYLSGSRSQKAVVETYNVYGQKIYTEELQQAKTSYKINLDNQPSGIYFIRVLTDNGTLLGEDKIIIDR